MVVREKPRRLIEKNGECENKLGEFHGLTLRI